MVDRIKRYKNHERWPRDWENICREGDEGQLRRYIQSHKFDALSSSKKIDIIKCILIFVPSVRTAEELLRTALFSKAAECRLRPDSLDANGSTLAHFAAQRENPAPLFRCLKDLGTNLIRPNKVGMSTLHFLFFKTGPRHTRTLREAAAYLCKQPRCFIDLRDNEGETPLLVACLRKDPLNALTVLHDFGADMKMVTRHRQTALHLVASSCAPSQLESTVKFLIKNDVDPQQMDDDGKTMLHYINERNDILRRQKEQICTLVNPYQNGPFSPRSSSGFSEKMSLDYCDHLYPEYPVNCSPMTSTPLIRTTQIPSAACSNAPPPLAPTSCSSSSTSCCSPQTSSIDLIIPGTKLQLLQLGTTQPTTTITTTPASRYPQSVKEQEPDEPLATLLKNKNQEKHKETQTECYRDQEMESLKTRLRELEAERDAFSSQCKRMSERLERYESCQICLEPYSASERMTLRSCGHMMCIECAHKWLRETPQCPQCRADYTSSDLVKSLIL